MTVFTTEIASDKITSDNPIHQRLLKPYYLALNYVSGDLLEVGCGQGRGIDLLLTGSSSYTGIDKIETVIESLRSKYPSGTFHSMIIPPFTSVPENRYDFVISFQVIEHINNDKLFLQEIFRVLKPGGKALLTTPNIKMSLSRNPWHIREYTATQLEKLALEIFPKVTMMGITGNEKVMAYHEENRQAVRRIMKWDILNLQYKLPAWLLRIPYEILNRWNRGKLQNQDSGLVQSISYDDYILTKDPDTCLDLFCILEK